VLFEPQNTVLGDAGSLGHPGLRKLVPHPLPREFLKTCRAIIEEMHAWANLEVIQILQDREERDRAHFGGLRHQYADPSDVLIKAARLKGKSARKERHK
jgi:hypothetical protein